MSWGSCRQQGERHTEGHEALDRAGRAGGGLGCHDDSGVARLDGKAEQHRAGRNGAKKKKRSSKNN